MADIERQLVSRIAQSGGVEAALRAGIMPEHFVDTQCREIFETCSEHTRKYGTPPSYEAVRKKHPDFGFEVVTDALEYISDEFVTLVKWREGVKALRELGSIVDDPTRAATIDADFLEAARRLAQIVPSDNVMRMSEMPKRIELWKQMRELGEMPGIPMGIPTFDTLTLGVQPYEFVAIVGWQGTGKSTLLQYIMLHAYLNGYTPLLISLEMQAEALYRKWDIMLANAEKDIDEAIKYHDLKKLEMSDRDLRRLEEQAENVARAKNDILVQDGVGKCTVDKIYAETVRYRPDIVGVDYLSLMDAPKHVSGSMWEKVTYLTNNFKSMARSLNTPMYGIAQTNIDSAAGGAALENIAYSRSIGQDADIVLGLHQDEDMKSNKQMECRMLKQRDGETAKTPLFWDMSIMKFREWSPSDMFQRQH